MALAKAKRAHTGPTQIDKLLHDVQPCPECGGNDREEFKAENLILTCNDCGYRAEFDINVLKVIASAEER